MNKILHVAVNQTFDYISCATTKGYEIYQINPFNKKREYNFKGSLSLTTMLYSTNIIVCVGGIHMPIYKNSKTIIVWDMNVKEEIHSYLCCQPISTICVTHRHIIVNYQDHIEVLSLNTCKSLITFKTCMFPKSVCKVYNNVSLLAFTSYKKGKIRLWKKSTVIELQAHDSTIIDIHLSVQGDKIITVSNNHIKIYDVETLKLYNCIDINMLNSNLIHSTVDMYCKYMLLYHKNGLLHIFDLKTSNVWNLYIENILYSVILLKQKSKYPKVYIFTKEKQLKSFQLVKNGHIICI